MFLHWEQTTAGRFRISSLDGRRFHNASNEGRQGQCGSNTPRRARKTIRWSLCGGSSGIKLRCLRKKRLPKVLNCSDKCFPCTFWNRVVKLSIHERLAPLRRGCADAADSSARVYGSTRAERARHRFGKSNAKRRRRERRQSTRTSWFVVFSTTAKWSAVRGEGRMHGRLGRTFTSAGVLDEIRLTHSRRTISKWINCSGAAASGTKLSYSRRRRRGMF